MSFKSSEFLIYSSNQMLFGPYNGLDDAIDAIKVKHEILGQYSLLTEENPIENNGFSVYSDNMKIIKKFILVTFGSKEIFYIIEKN